MRAQGGVRYSFRLRRDNGIGPEIEDLIEQQRLLTAWVSRSVDVASRHRIRIRMNHEVK